MYIIVFHSILERGRIMSNLFTPAKRESAVDLVVNSIKQLLMDRKLKPGQKLPSELEISEGLGVSRGSVREATKILSAFGLIDIRVGDGTYVCKSPGNDLMDTLLFSFYITNPNVKDMRELRVKVEEDIMELIIDYYDDNAVERAAIKKNLEQLQHLIDTNADYKSISDNDLNFHHFLGDATHNILAARVYNFIISIMESSIMATHRKQHGEYSLKVHTEIVNLIEARDYSRIKDAVKYSVDVWSELQDKENSNQT